MIEIEIVIEIDVRQLSDFDIDFNFDDSWPSLKVPLEHATIQHLEIIDVLQRTKWPWGAAEAGYEVLIIDSLTHAWAGEGGILEFVDRATQAVKNNFAAWREASPKHNQLVDAILGAPLHVIATIRSKTAWEVVKDERTGTYFAPSGGGGNVNTRDGTVWTRSGDSLINTRTGQAVPSLRKNPYGNE